MANRRRVGAEHETAAADYLASRGYRIAERNFRCRLGEIDIIARNRGTLVFVEVKYRSSGARGLPEEAVNARKRHVICRVADYYRLTHGIPETQPCRFDVVSILSGRITHIENAFEYQ